MESEGRGAAIDRYVREERTTTTSCGYAVIMFMMVTFRMILRWH
jgi:hypothetical protein